MKLRNVALTHEEIKQLMHLVECWRSEEGWLDEDTRLLESEDSRFAYSLYIALENEHIMACEEEGDTDPWGSP